MYEIGTKVRIIDDGNSESPTDYIGKIGTVKDISEPNSISPGDYWVAFDEDIPDADYHANDLAWFGETELEAV